MVNILRTRGIVTAYSAFGHTWPELVRTGLKGPGAAQGCGKQRIKPRRITSGLQPRCLARLETNGSTSHAVKPTRLVSLDSHLGRRGIANEVCLANMYQ